MSESPKSGGGPGTGCLIAAVAGAVVLFVALAAAGVGGFLYLQRRAAENVMVLPPAAGDPDQATVEGDGVVHGGSAPDEAGDDGEDEDDVVCALPVLVKLAGRSDAGEVRYVIDRQDEVVGDAALIAALEARLEAEKLDPEEYLPLIVDLDVATASGVTQAEVDAVVKACWAAGAAVLRPPDISREKKENTE